MSTGWSTPSKASADASISGDAFGDDTPSTAPPSRCISGDTPGASTTCSTPVSSGGFPSPITSFQSPENPITEGEEEATVEEDVATVAGRIDETVYVHQWFDFNGWDYCTQACWTTSVGRNGRLPQLRLPNTVAEQPRRCKGCERTAKDLVVERETHQAAEERPPPLRHTVSVHYAAGGAKLGGKDFSAELVGDLRDQVCQHLEQEKGVRESCPRGELPQECINLYRDKGTSQGWQKLEPSDDLHPDEIIRCVLQLCPSMETWELDASLAYITLDDDDSFVPRVEDTLGALHRFGLLGWPPREEIVEMMHDIEGGIQGDPYEHVCRTIVKLVTNESKVIRDAATLALVNISLTQHELAKIIAETISKLPPTVSLPRDPFSWPECQDLTKVVGKVVITGEKDLTDRSAIGRAVKTFQEALETRFPGNVAAAATFRPGCVIFIFALLVPQKPEAVRNICADQQTFCDDIVKILKGLPEFSTSPAIVSQVTFWMVKELGRIFLDLPDSHRQTMGALLGLIQKPSTPLRQKRVGPPLAFCLLSQLV